MNSKRTVSFVENQLKRTFRKETLAKTGYSLTFEPDTDESVCISPNLLRMDIHIGTKELHDDETKIGYVSNGSYVKIFSVLFHELGHANTYEDIGFKLRHNMELSQTEKDVYTDIILAGLVPEYQFAAYTNMPDEKLAEIHSLNKMKSMASDNNSIFNKAGLSVQNICIKNIKSSLLWYSSRTDKVNSIRSFDNAINLLKSELHDNSCGLYTKISKIKRQPLTLYHKEMTSMLSSIYAKPELKSYLDGSDTRCELRQRLFDSIYTVNPELITLDFTTTMPDNMRFPRKLIIKSDREIRNKPDFKPDSHEHDYTYDT